MGFKLSLGCLNFDMSSTQNNFGLIKLNSNPTRILKIIARVYSNIMLSQVNPSKLHPYQKILLKHFF